MLLTYFYINWSILTFAKDSFHIIKVRLTEVPYINANIRSGVKKVITMFENMKGLKC